jgi:hypothetical protein
VPLANEPLAWDSKELAGLAAYVESVGSDFNAAPAAPSNPYGGGMSNPSGM